MELWKHQVDKTKHVYLITRGSTPVIVLLDIEEAWKYAGKVSDTASEWLKRSPNA